MKKNLPGAGTLPFAGFVTHDFKWVGGFSGYKDEAAFAKLLDEVEKSPLLNATDAVRKKLAPLADRAGKAAEKKEWKSVLKAFADAAELTGRCEERTKLEDLEKAARGWAEEQLAAAVTAAAAADGDLAEARRVLNEVKKQFAGQPEYADAEKGLKALMRLDGLRKMETLPEGALEKAAAEFEGSRWAAVFGK